MPILNKNDTIAICLQGQKKAFLERERVRVGGVHASILIQLIMQKILKRELCLYSNVLE
jgi:hypothetical protein